LGLLGPITNEQVTLENRHISLFRDPATGGDFGNSSNRYNGAKHLELRQDQLCFAAALGIQIGASFTPKPVRTPLPFTGNLPNGPNQQQNI
jgi:hypothetical protein